MNLIPVQGGNAVMDATGEQVAFIGHCYIDGRAASKTISAAGGGSISFRVNSLTFANGGTTLDVGIQDISTSSGPVARPDGTFDVKKTLTGGGGGLSANSWNTISMTSGSGSKTISHGDLIAVMFDMTARAGADSVQIGTTYGIYPSNYATRPTVMTNLGGWASLGASGVPNCLITFDDGTLGILDGTLLSDGAGITSEDYSDSTNPDERGVVFQVPWDCKIDAYYVRMNQQSGAAADCTLKLYSAPTTAASAVANSTITILGEQLDASFQESTAIYTLPAAISLSKNTDYCLALKADSTGTIGLYYYVQSSATHRAFLPGGTTMAKATRNNGAGNFSTTTTTQYMMGVRISSFDDGTGSGSGGGSRSRIQTGH